MKKLLTPNFWIVSLFAVLALAVPQESLLAVTTLTVTPITWNVIGLDSNNVAVGPNQFAVGVRVTNTGVVTASNVQATFVWDTANANINLRSGSLNPFTFASLAPGASTDFYFEVVVTRTVAAYDTTRNYHIAVTADAGATTASSPLPRQLYVERLVSQGRNSYNAMSYGPTGGPLVSVLPGGTFALNPGGTYDIRIDVSTAPGGYEQVESFINFQNTVFRINSVNTTYATWSGVDLTRLYADGCGWVNDPNDPAYRSCTGTGKNGGNMTITYNVTILSVPSTNPDPLNVMIYDFSGSSYHYNSNYGSSTTYIYIVDPTAQTFAKSFAPNPAAPGGVTSLTFTIGNPTPASVSSVNFVDNLPTSPGAMVVAPTPAVTTSGCGASPIVTANAGSGTITLTGADIAANGTCSIKVNVTTPLTPTSGSYVNTSLNLFVGATNTTKTATATLTVQPATVFGPCTPGTQLVQWTMPTAAGTGTPPLFTAGTKSPQVSSALASFTGASQSINTTIGGSTSGVNSWSGVGPWNTATAPDPTFTAPGATNYFEFTLDTSQFSGGTGVSISFQVNPTGTDWGGNNNNATYVYSSANGGPFSTIFQGLTNKNVWSQAPTVLAASTGFATTTFRINGGGATSTIAPLLIDNIVFTGCAAVTPSNPPTLSKAFAPSQIPLNGTSVLTFTLANNSVGAVPLTGVKFTDTLPAGLQVAATPAFSTTCAGSPTWAPTAGATTLTFGNPTGASMLAGSTCTVQVNVTGTTTGPHANTSGYIFSRESGSNTTATGFGTANLDVLSPPALAKAFGATTILTGSTTSLTFTISNPNAFNTLTGVAFTDTLPTGLTVATAAPAAQCGGFLSTTNPTTISFTGGSLAASSTCSFSVTVTGATGSAAPGTTYTNLTGAVTSTNGGTGNTATAQLVVKTVTKALKILKQVGPSNTGPWSTYLVVTTPNVFFQFTVENTGDAAIVGAITINDPGVTIASCTPTPLSAGLPVFGVTTCTSTAFPSPSGTNTNSASATGDAVTSNTSTVAFGTVNFGHLPVGGACPNCFPASATNLTAGGGARHETGDSFLGSARPSEPNGIDNSTFTADSAFDDGVTAIAPWVTGGTGSVSVKVVCPAAPCFLNAWIDWGQDGSFAQAGDQIFTNQSMNNATVTLTFPIPSTAVLSGTAFGRFRLFKSAPSGAIPTGFATVGEVEDYAFNLDALNTTPVTLAYFEAHRQGNGYHVEWSTASEAGNVGFALYTPASSAAADKDNLMKITQQLVRSTAKDPVSPQEYFLDTTANAPSGVFYLGDLDIYGKVKMHGPFSAGKPYGRKLKPAKTDWSAIAKEHGKHKKEQDDEDFAAMAKGGSSAVRANLIVKTDGVYAVTYEALLAAGFNFGGVSKNNLSLFNKGTAVPIEVTGAGSTFGPGSAVQFYGKALNTIYTFENVYTLSIDKGNLLRIDLEETKPSTATPAASYMETVKVNNNINYDLGSTSGDPWNETTLLTYSSPVSASFPITLDNVAGTSGASLGVDFYGVTDFPLSPDHHVQVQVNGATVSDQLFDGAENKNIVVPLGSGLIHEGVNTMTLSLPGDTGADYDLVSLDRYSITYPRQFLARAGRLTFSSTGSFFRVDALPTPNVVVYRLSDNTTTRLTGAIVEPSANGYAVRFSGSGQAATYVVTTQESVSAPALSVPRTPAGLTSGPAQLLVISHPDFINNLGPLVSARQSEGLSVKIVNVKDVYAQYSFGNFDPAAIKSYITYAAASMGTKYVLLVGGDTYDYRNDLGIGAVGFIPTLYKSTDAYLVYTPVDPLFGDVNGDGVPDVAVGRLPVRTTAELDSVIRKTLAYGNKSYGKTAFFTADENEPGISYKATNESFMASLPADWTKQQANVGDAGGVTVARTSLINAMNSGVAFVSYFGHSSTDIWTFSGLFNSGDAVALTNFRSPTFVNQLGCWNTYYVSPYYETLAHAFLLTGDQGAAGVAGGSALTEAGSDMLLGRYLIPRLATPGTRVGSAMIGAKKDAAAAAQGINIADVLLGYVLLGDPTLKIQP